MWCNWKDHGTRPLRRSKHIIVQAFLRLLVRGYSQRRQVNHIVRRKCVRTETAYSIQNVIDTRVGLRSHHASSLFYPVFASRQARLVDNCYCHYSATRKPGVHGAAGSLARSLSLCVSLFPSPTPTRPSTPPVSYSPRPPCIRTYPFTHTRTLRDSRRRIRPVFSSHSLLHLVIILLPTPSTSLPRRSTPPSFTTSTHRHVTVDTDQLPATVPSTHLPDADNPFTLNHYPSRHYPRFLRRSTLSFRPATIQHSGYITAHSSSRRTIHLAPSHSLFLHVA
jgi:hypothetical protein